MNAKLLLVGNPTRYMTRPRLGRTNPRSLKYNISKSCFLGKKTIIKNFILCKYSKYVKKLTQRVSLTFINTITCSRFWFIKTMFFKLTRLRLTVPCWRTWSMWIKIPKSKFRWVVPPIIQILFC
jgi:hypothetical protein